MVSASQQKLKAVSQRTALPPEPRVNLSEFKVIKPAAEAATGLPSDCIFIQHLHHFSPPKPLKTCYYHSFILCPLSLKHESLSSLIILSYSCSDSAAVTDSLSVVQVGSREPWPPLTSTCWTRTTWSAAVWTWALPACPSGSTGSLCRACSRTSTPTGSSSPSSASLLVSSKVL